MTQPFYVNLIEIVNGICHGFVHVDNMNNNNVCHEYTMRFCVNA